MAQPAADSCGTAAPQAATSGASGSVILSPTPPVECLSAVGRESAGEVHPLPRGDHRGGPAGDLAAVMPLSRIAIASADICSSATTPRVYASTTQSIWLSAQRRLRRAWRDDVDRVERAHRAFLSGSARSCQVVRAERVGQHLVIGRTPVGRSAAAGPGPPCSQSSCRQRPHGMSSSPGRSRTRRRQPAAARGVQLETSPHSAHSVTPYAGVLHVAADHAAGRRRPAPAAPTGSASTARTRAPMTSIAAARSAAQSTARPAITSALHVRLAVGRRRPDPADEPGDRDDRRDVGSAAGTRSGPSRRGCCSWSCRFAGSRRTARRSIAPIGFHRPKISAASAMKPCRRSCPCRRRRSSRR